LLKAHVAHLVFWVVNHWWFPFAVHLIIPVIGLLGIRISNVLGLFPVLWLGVFWVVDLLTLIPVVGLLGFWVL